MDQIILIIIFHIPPLKRLYGFLTASTQPVGKVLSKPVLLPDDAKTFNKSISDSYNVKIEDFFSWQKRKQ